MRLASGRQVHAGKFAVDDVVEVRYVNLREVHVDLMLAADPADALAVDDGETEFPGKYAIDTACRRAGIDKGLDADHAGSRRRAVRLRPEVLVKPDVHMNGGTVPC